MNKRSTMRLSTLIGAVALVTAAAAPASAQNLVFNPGFENTPSLQGYTVATCEAGLGAFRSGIFGRTGSFGLAFNSRSCNATVTQTLNTVAGQNYDISFWYRTNNVATPNNLTFSFDGVELFNQALTNLSYQQFTFSAVATSSMTDIVFAGRSPGANAVDDVSITAGTPTAVVPEPSTVALMTAGLAGLFGIARLRRRESIRVKAL